MARDDEDSDQAADEERPRGKRPEKIPRTGEQGEQQEQLKDLVEEEEEEQEEEGEGGGREDP